MSRARLLLVAVAAFATAAYALLRAVTAPEPYATLARPAAARPSVGAGRVGVAGEPVEGATPREPPPAGVLRAALARLDAARVAGFADPAAADPDDWAAPTCSCRAEDVRRLRALAARGLALRGHRAAVLGLRVVRAGPWAATVVVTDRVAGYAVVDRRGRVVARWAPAEPRTWRVTLVRVTGRWLLGRIVRGP